MRVIAAENHARSLVYKVCSIAPRSTLTYLFTGLMEGKVDRRESVAYNRSKGLREDAKTRQSSAPSRLERHLSRGASRRRSFGRLSSLIRDTDETGTRRGLRRSLSQYILRQPMQSWVLGHPWNAHHHQAFTRVEHYFTTLAFMRLRDSWLWALDRALLSSSIFTIQTPWGGQLAGLYHTI